MKGVIKLKRSPEQIRSVISLRYMITLITFISSTVVLLVKGEFESERMKFREDLHKLQKADFNSKAKDKVIQIDIFPEKVKQSLKSTEEVDKKLKVVSDKFNEVYKLVGVGDLSEKFILPEPLYAMATRVKYGLEKNMQENKYKSFRGSLPLIMGDFNELAKEMGNQQQKFYKEQIFSQGEIEKVG